MSPSLPLRGALLFILAAAPLLHAEPKTVLGVTEPLMDVILSSPAQGTVFEHKFHEGDEVRKGDVLLELDSTLERLEAQRRHEVAERSRTDYENTKSLFERTKSVSREEMEKKSTEYKVAVAEEGIANEQLKRRLIVAPFAGSIAEIYLQPGAGCEPYQPLLRLVQTKECQFIGHLEGAAAAGLKIGQPATISMAEGQQSVEGRVSFIAPVADSASGLVRLKAVFPNPEGRVRPGLSASLILP